MNQRRASIKIRVENTDYDVTGGEFQDLLAAVKALPGRRFIGDQKVWQVTGSLEMVRGQLENSGYLLEGGVPVSEEVKAKAASFNDRIKIQVAGFKAVVVGGSFSDMLAAIKELPDRRFDGDSKEWQIGGHFSELKAYLEKRDFRLENVTKMEDDDSPADKPSSAEAAPPLFDEAPPPEPPIFWGDDEEPHEGDEVVYFDDAFPPPPPPPIDDASPPTPQEASETMESEEKSPARFSGRRDQIRVLVGNQSLVVVGGTFQEMLTAIKAIPDRRFDGESKRWLLPDDISSVQQHLNAQGFQLQEEF